MSGLVFRYCAAFCAAGFPIAALAADVDLNTGSGSDYAELVVHFGDDERVTYGVTFDAAAESWTGTDLVAFVSSASGGQYLDGSDAAFVPPTDFGDDANLDVIIKVFSFGSFFDGFGYDASSDIGFGGGEDYWHFWEGTFGVTSPVAWTSPFHGASDFAIVDQSAVGFRYGSDLSPLSVPEPGTLALVMIVGGAVLRRRR